MTEQHCSRLSDNAAPDAGESETVFRSCGRKDDSPSCHGNWDAGNQIGNPDVRVPERSEIDDGLSARETEEEGNADNEEERGEDAEDGSRNGNSEVPLKIDGCPWAKKRAATRELRHVPGGTWLTKEERSQASIKQSTRFI
ncbi:hypothetical protein NDU88_003542 [Pleurodeles waltl]|uniref:Uncharacterized protein n=1 Tax=Pleurodeles waltl TaxID=8319 RepID=A0AAV7WT21_PLEWA|nr:hypothetical protein NDU88_003542 [Pleurodeles waltl]